MLTAKAVENEKPIMWLPYITSPTLTETHASHNKFQNKFYYFTGQTKEYLHSQITAF